MITRDEIDQKSVEFEINSSNVERDYVFGWVLFGIFTISNLKETIFLKGGNALRKGYFKNTRFSSDLDFGIPSDIDQNMLLDELNKVCDFIHEKSGVNFSNEENKIEEKFTATTAPTPDLRVYEARIYFRDFYNQKSDHIKIKISMDITRFDKVLLPLQSLPLIHPYSDAEELECEITCMKLEEIIATKLKCLLQRQHAPDLFDYVNTIKQLGGDLNKEEVVDVFINKTIFKRNPAILKDILKETPFDYFKEYWQRTVICAKELIFDVEEAIDIFLSDLDILFSAYPSKIRAEYAFFLPEMRWPIIQAGRTQTLLKIRYNGEDRVVEPYSLKYQQRKDGIEQEYLYVYNCTGGKSQPGIRCFVANGIESVECTEEKFEPRYQIELCKAGELPENPYLFDPNKPEKRIKRRRFLSSKSTIKYIYQCNHCGKKFTRTRQTPVIAPHKNSDGYQCGGRYGHYVDTRY